MLCNSRCDNKFLILCVKDSVVKGVWQLEKSMREREGQREIAKEGQREALDNILDKWNVKQIRWLLIKMQMKLYSH